ncbi:MAG: helix-turn-helix transcriptional regulator [Clostridia bacterium]|nr:helix-turn-helix transcriptional regulator [Clostridia bacterium]
MINFKQIGQRVKNARNENGYTQEEFSEMLGVSVEHLSRIETGSCRPSLNLIERICKALQVSEEAIMFGNINANSQHSELANKIACLSIEKQQALNVIIDLISE